MGVILHSSVVAKTGGQKWVTLGTSLYLYNGQKWGSSIYQVTPLNLAHPVYDAHCAFDVDWTYAYSPTSKISHEQ